jgi:hypothetical protein
MSNIKPTTNSSLPDRLYGEHYPDSFIDMPKSILTSRYQLVDNNDKYVREERQQSDQPIITNQSVSAPASSTPFSTSASSISTPSSSGNNPDGTKAERTRTEEGRPRSEAKGTGTEEGRTRSQDGSQDGFSDNLEYTGIPIPAAKGKDSVSGWPCVVVGAVCETWTTAAEHVLRTTASKWDTKQHIDARRDYDGFIKANGI